jgi:hypothetical protein
MGKDKRNIGTVTGSNLYGQVWNLLDKACPNKNNGPGSCPPAAFGMYWFSGSCVISFLHSVRCNTFLYDITGYWKDDQTRRLLIGAVAGALEAVTSPDKGVVGTNCYDGLPGKGCCVGDVVRVC